MSLSQIRELVRKWYKNDEVAEFKDAIDAALISIGLTDEYIDYAAAARQRRHRIDIKDEVWGMITVESDALALLDSPILQRLRAIKQLGFSYLVYPSADHSRFSHSLGVFHVARQYADEINRQGTDSSRRLASGLKYARLDTQDSLDLFHAALLHDVGHLPFSHVAEAVFESAIDEFRVGGLSVRQFIVPAMHVGELSLSEALSLAIVLSPRFGKFYDAAVRPGDVEAPLRMAALICGCPVRNDNVALPELLSSSIDVDKIDYQLRDSRACNIPVGVDVSRLFHRSAFITAEPQAVPDGVADENRELDKPLTMFAVNASGIDTIEEIAVARTVLYQRVYSHRVTRNAERLLAKALFDLIGSGDPIARELTDALAVWKLTDDQLLKQIAIAGQNKPAGDIVRSIRLRQLPRRTCAFGPALVAPLVPIGSILAAAVEGSGKSWNKLIHGNYADQLKSENLRGRALEALENKVAKAAVTLRDQLAGAGVQNLPGGSPHTVTVLPLPDLGKKQYNGLVLEPHGEIGAAKHYTRIQQLTDAEELGNIVGFVHADVTWAPLVALGFRDVIYNHFSLSSEALKDGQLTFGGVDRSTCPCHYLTRFRLDIEKFCRRARVDVDEVRRLHRELTEARAYDDRPLLAPSYSGVAAAKIAQRFQEFSGERGWHVSIDSVRAFIGQFRPDLRDHVAKLLADDHGVTFLGRSKTVTLLERAMTHMAGRMTTARRFIAPLSPNSGYHVRMILEQDLKKHLESSGWLMRHSILEVLGQARPGDALVLCDDNVSSGSQSLAQFLRWFNRPRTDWPTEIQDETGIDDVALRDNDLELLRKLSVGIVVCVQGDKAESKLTAGLAPLGVGFVGISSGQTLASGEKRFNELPNDLQAALKEIGAAALMHVRQNDPRSKKDATTMALHCENDALGYGGLKGLTITQSNVPTSTLPALWCPGMFKNEPWMPLFIRRGYLRHLVVA